MKYIFHFNCLRSIYLVFICYSKMVEYSSEWGLALKVMVQCPHLSQVGHVDPINK